MDENLRRWAKSVIWGSLYFLRYLAPLNEKCRGKSSFLITIDVETANDFIHWMDKQSAVRKAYQNRTVIEKIINFSSKNQFPLTWLCTGHSLLENCCGHELRIYSWATVKNGFVEGFERKDWFKSDPCKNCQSHPEWYFGDLFKQMSKGNVNHEIGSHTFGHIRADLASEKEFVEDTNELLSVHKKLGLRCLSFAYPWNKIGHPKILEDFGINVCRLKKSRFPSSIREPKRSSLTYIYQSFEGRPASFQVLKFGVNLAVKLGLPFIWLIHPEEILEHSNWGVFNRVAEYVISLRQRKELSILTMREVAKRF